MKISVSSPYRENSIVNMAGVLATTDQLQRFYTPLYLAQWERTAKRIPLAGSRLAREFGRREFPGIPAQCVQSASTGAELINVGVRRLFGRRHPEWSAHLNAQNEGKI